MGKSALLGYAAQAQGMHVLRARGVQSEASIPFAGLFELLRPVLNFLDRIPGPLGGGPGGSDPHCGPLKQRTASRRSAWPP